MRGAGAIKTASSNWLDRRVSAPALLAWVCLTAPSMLVLLDLTLAYVRAFLDADVKLLARDPVGRLDNLLREVQRDVDAAPDAARTTTTPLGIAILTALLAASWAAAVVRA